MCIFWTLRPAPEPPVYGAFFSKVKRSERPERESNNSPPSKGAWSCTSTTLNGFVEFREINLLSPSVSVSSQFITGPVMFHYRTRLCHWHSCRFLKCKPIKSYSKHEPKTTNMLPNITTVQNMIYTTFYVPINFRSLAPVGSPLFVQIIMRITFLYFD